MEEKYKGWVSIIIPVYKVRDYIQECICSVIYQTYQNIEIILIDDHGDDGSIELAEALLEKSERRWFIITQNINKGVSAARNIGIKQSFGEYLFFLDADDYLSEFCIERHVNAICRDSSEMVFANHVDLVDGCIVPSIRVKDKDYYSDNPILELGRWRLTSMVWNILFRKDLYMRVAMPFKEGIRGEDAPWIFSHIIRAKRISLITDSTYYYRRWSGAYTCSLEKNESYVSDWYYCIQHCTKETLNLPIWKHRYFRSWYARNILDFLFALILSQCKTAYKYKILKTFFSEIRIPYIEISKITYGLFMMVKVIPWMHFKYFWIKLLFIVSNVVKNTRCNRMTIMF